MVSSQFIAVIGVVCTALLAAAGWWLKLIFTRRHEVAEQVMAAIEPAVNALHLARRSKVDSLNQTGEFRTDAFLIQQLRLTGAVSSFQALSDAGKSAAMYFGNSDAEPIKEITAIYDQVCAAHTGIHSRSVSERMYPSMWSSEQIARNADWIALLDSSGADDPIDKRVDELHAQIRRRFGRYLKWWPFR